MRTRKWAGLALGIWACVAIWVGCGGSESSSSSGGPVDSGPETATTDANKPDTAGGPVDAPFDGFIDAPEVELTFGTCAAFTACGGDEVGSWKVSGGCLSDSFLAPAQDACAGFTTSNETIKAKGIVTADGTNIVRRTQVTLTAKAFIPLSCAPGGFNNCNAIAAGAQFQYGFDKATCVANDAGDGCNCDIQETLAENATDTYTKSGNTLTTGNGDTFDYCVASGKLTYTQTNSQGNQPPYPLFIELTK
jgi:hypothetical protein